MHARPVGRRVPFAVILLLHVLALAVFVHGYLLTRVHLKQRNTVNDAGCSRPYRKLVWVVIDALRYDFLIPDERYPCAGGPACAHQGAMPGVAALLRHPGAARAFLYLAEAPTTTTQRLKAMVSGGPPSFFDVSTAFTAVAMEEDNLIDQLAAGGRRLAFVGDATWADLFPTQFHPSLPFPCFNIKDLHTVDDGVWSHLIPDFVRQPEAWDVLVAHYLGLDHAGHAHGVPSAEMAAKVRQTDGQVAQAVEEMLKGAGPGGPYADTLVLISGDHGQTLSGDHGGGSPEEVDSALVAVDLGALWQARQNAPSSDPSSDPAPLLAAACRATCSCGDDANQCAADLRQSDLVPTLAALLGVPVPFANLGRVSPELWGLGAGRCSRGGEGWQAALARAAAANARQVHEYLAAYARLPASRFPGAAMRSLAAAFASLPAPAEGCGEGGNDCGVAEHLAFLAAAGDVARQAWTQFRDGWMAAGLALFAGAFALHAAAAWASMRRAGVVLTPATVLAAVLAVGPVGQAVGTFSFFYLLSEGRMVCMLLAAMTAVLTLATCAHARRHGRNRRTITKLAALGAAALACNAAMASLGLARSSGYGFWQRLTVHEPADSDPPGSNAGVDPGSFSTTAAALAVLNWAGVPADAAPSVLVAAVHAVTHTLPILILGRLASRQLQPCALMQALFSAAYSSVAVHHAWEFVVGQSWAPAGSTAAMLAQSLPSGSVVSVALSAVHPRLVALPLRLLLPRLTLALCAAAALVLALRAARLRTGQAAAGGGAIVMALALLAARTSVPLVPLLAAAQLSALTALLAAQAQQGGEAVGVAAAALLAAAQTQVFFVTGHLCEFAGLEYTAGFVGFDDFHLYRTASLVAVETFGGMLVVALALPGVAAVLSASGSPQRSSKRKTAPRLGSAPGGAWLTSMLLVFGLARAAAAFCAALSAAVQRRHLYAWALFAPKFVFEVFFLLLTDVVVLLMG